MQKKYDRHCVCYFFAKLTRQGGEPLLLVFISTTNEVLKSYKGLDEKIKAKLMDDINSSDLCFDGFKILISTIIDILSGKIKPIDINLNKT